MNFNNYTQKSLEAVQSARDLAVQNNHQQIPADDTFYGDDVDGESV